MIQLFHEFCAIKHGVFKFVVESECAMRAARHAEHAIHATAVVVDMFDEHLALFAVFSLPHFRLDDNRVIGADHLTDATPYAFVFIEFVVRENELSAEAFEHFARFPIFGVTLGDFRSPKFAHRHFQTGAQTLYTSHKTGEVALLFHNRNSLLRGELKGEAEAHEERHADE